MGLTTPNDVQAEDAGGKASLNKLTVTLIWAGLLLGLCIQIGFYFGELGIWLLVSVFDFYVPVITIIGMYQGWLPYPSKRMIWALAAVVLAIALHSSLYWIISGWLHPVTLAKESIKLIAIVVSFGCLMILFGNKDLRTPPKVVVAVLLAVSIPIVILISHYEAVFIARTVMAVTLSGLVFCMGQDGAWLRSAGERAWLVLASLAVMVTAVLIYNKGVAGAMLAVAVWFALGNRMSKLISWRAAAVALGLLLTIIGGIALVGLAGKQLPLLERMDSIERSISVRMALAELGLRSMIATFPVGHGLGQFPQALSAAPELAAEMHKSIHNSFIGLMSDLGLIGIVFAVGLGVIVAMAAFGWSAPILPLFVLIIVPPLVIHDGHSIRLLLVIVALGLMRRMDPAARPAT